MNSQDTSPSLLIDVGNTSIHIGFAFRDLKHSFRVSKNELGKIRENWSGWRSDREPEHILLASVNPETEQTVRSYLTTTWDRRPLRFGEDIPIPIDVNTETPEEVGDDRLLNAVGVRSRYRSAAVVVDCGTAVTFDVVSSGGAFEGGVIAPGISISAQALHDHTAMLPEVTPESTEEAFGKNTESAIQSGIYHGFTGMVRHILKQILREVDGTPPVIGVGGDLYLFDCPEALFDEIDRNLTLKGLLDAWKQGSG